MKYIRKYNESSRSLSKDDLIDYFSNTFDICKRWTIEDDLFFDPKDNEVWANNDFSNPNIDSQPDYCDMGFYISIYHSFYDSSNVNDFKGYLSVINEFNSDMDRFISIFNPKYLEFKITDDCFILLINP